MGTPGRAQGGLIKLNRVINQSLPTQPQGHWEVLLLPPLSKYEIRGFLHGETDQAKRTKSETLTAGVSNEIAQPAHLPVKSTRWQTQASPCIF